MLAAAGSGPEPGSKAKQPAATTSSRNARLYELVDDDGWGVEAVPSASQPQPAAAGAAAATPASASKQKQKQKQQVKPAKGEHEGFCCTAVFRQAHALHKGSRLVGCRAALLRPLVQPPSMHTTAAVGSAQLQ